MAEALPFADEGAVRRRRAPAADASIELVLEVRDPELVAELGEHAEGRARDAYALSALRLGLLALRQARGEVDAETVRREGDRLLAGLEQRLGEHQARLNTHLTETLRTYFDPDSGRFAERVDRLVRRDGELEQLLRRQIGEEDSALARTLAAHVGESSPLLELLHPDESRGLLRALAGTLEQALGGQRERILREFSLDHKESALSRLVTELAQSHGKLTETLQGSIDGVVGEFSLDREDSALSLLVRRVESAQSRIHSEFSLDEENSALARMRRELLEVLEGQRRASDHFREEVRATLSALGARREEVERSPRHGVEFEDAVVAFLEREAQRAGDVAERTGATTGLIRNDKKGDCVVTLGPDQQAAGARIAVEAKEDRSVTLERARAELEGARKNRGADVGLFVFSARSAPPGLDAFVRVGNDVFVVWDAEDERSDLVLRAGLSVARALCTRAAVERGARAADLVELDRAIREIERRAGGLEQVATWAETIRTSSEKILDKVRKTRRALERQIELLDETRADLHEALAQTT